MAWWIPLAAGVAFARELGTLTHALERSGA